MLERLLNFALAQRFLVLAATVLVAAWGVVSWGRLNLDAVPDITTNQVTVNTETGGMGPEEVERLVTFPIETAMGGLPGVEGTRSLSQYGLSQVTVTFEDTVDTFFARQLVNERLGRVAGELPTNVEAPQMGPVSTGLGDIYMFTLESEKRAPMDLRAIMDWQIAPQLRTVKGVAEINVADGSVKQYQVVVDPQRLQARGLGIAELIESLERNNQNAGGGVMDRNGERILIRSVGVARNAEDIGRFVVATEGGIPILVRDVAEVTTGIPVLTGLSTKDGREAILAIGMMLKGANGRTVAQALDAKIGEIRGQLPSDVKLTTVYNRAHLVDKTVGTVTKSLLEGGALVILVLLVLLGNLRGALTVAIAIPLSMLIAVSAMNQFGISGNLMSLGAIDFGLIVDGAVVMIENSVRRLAERREHAERTLTREEVRETVGIASREVAKPTAFAVSIITVVYLPILALEGTEGKMFRPMAFTVVFALLGALLLTLTLVPALASMVLSGDTREGKNPIMGSFDRVYRRALGFALRRRGILLGAAGLFLVGTFSLFGRLGSEFIPTLDEGDFVVQPIRVRTANAEETVRMVTAAERKALEVPEVVTMFSRSGTPEVASDPMPLSLTDSFVMLKPRSEWRPGMTKERIREELERKLEEVPGQGYNFSQPIQMRFAELVSGVKADIGIKVFGEDLAVLKRKADEIADAVRDIPGAQDVEVEQVEDIPVLQIEIDREAIARHGVSVADAQRFIGAALGGETFGQIVEGDRRYALTIRLPDAIRNRVEAISALPIKTGTGESVPLATLAHIANKPAPAQISREMGKRRVVVQLNVRGTDLGTFVAQAQAAIRLKVKLDEGTYVTWGGQFENLQRASARLTIVVPIALALIFTLLFLTFGSFRQALLIFTGVPLAVTGGIVGLYLRGMPFSISAGVGFIALSGVAVLNGVVMVSAINRLREEGRSVPDAVREGAQQRLRPVLMTALVAALGFIPMALNTGIGAEVQRPLATVVIGGIVSATLLTLLVLPALYTAFERGDRRGNP
ncbi:MAG: efflux RND transporter permease subunit [Fimbriimonas sp.]